jgi:tRNA U34 2-thiouridine synthase MnmA/TrmU
VHVGGRSRRSGGVDTLFSVFDLKQKKHTGVTMTTCFEQWAGLGVEHLEAYVTLECRCTSPKLSTAYYESDLFSNYIKSILSPSIVEMAR